MEILPSELFLLFEVSLFWVEIEDEGLLLIVLSIEASSDVLFISWHQCNNLVASQNHFVY